MKKGFTLIEVLAVVTIIGLIFVIAIPKIINSLNSKKSDIDNTTNNMIISAAKMYVNDHNTKFDKIEGAVYCLPLTTLAKEEYLDSKVKNVTDDKDITNIKSVKISYDNTFHYEIVNKKDCSVKTESYAELNYLESTGTQYIDTGVVDVNNLIWQVTISINNTSGRRIMGANFGSNFSSNDGYWQIGTLNTPITIIKGKKYLLEVRRTSTARILRVEDIETATTPPTQNNNIYFFDLNVGGAAYGEKVIGRIYDSKIYIDETIVRDFIPVLDNNGVACLYDKVENKYYYNQGTGEFLYG